MYYYQGKPTCAISYMPKPTRYTASFMLLLMTTILCCIGGGDILSFQSPITYASAQPIETPTYSPKGRRGFNCFSEASGWVHTVEEEAVHDSYSVATSAPLPVPSVDEYAFIAQNRSIPNCIIENTYGATTIMYAGMVISLIPGVLVALLCPLATCGRYTCGWFGSYKRRPNGFFWDGKLDDNLDEREKQKLYPPEQQRRIQWLCVILLCLAFVFAVLIIVGKNLTKSAYDDWKDDVRANLGVIADVTDIDSYLKYPNNDSYISPFTASSAEIALGASHASFAEYYISEADDYLSPTDYTILIIATNVYAVLPTAIFLLLLFACAYDIRKFVPIITVALLAFVSVTGSALGFFGFRLLGPVTMMCEEVDIFLNYEKSSEEFYDNVGTNKLIPQCKALLNESNIIRAALIVNEQAFAQQACDQLRPICDNANVPYSSPNNTDIQQFYCPDMPSSAPVCASATDVANYFYQSSPRTGTSNVCGPSITCNRYICATTCQNQETLNHASDASLAETISLNMRRAYNSIDSDPCEEVVTLLAQSFGKCNQAIKGIELIIAGLILNNLITAVGIIVAFRGQKVFFKRLRARRKKRHHHGVPGGDGTFGTTANSPDGDDGASKSFYHSTTMYDHSTTNFRSDDGDESFFDDGASSIMSVGRRPRSPVENHFFSVVDGAPIAVDDSRQGASTANAPDEHDETAAGMDNVLRQYRFGDDGEIVNVSDPSSDDESRPLKGGHSGGETHEYPAGSV